METVRNFRLQAAKTGGIYLLDGDRTVAVIPASNPNAAVDALLLMNAGRLQEAIRTFLMIRLVEPVRAARPDVPINTTTAELYDALEKGVHAMAALVEMEETSLITLKDTLL